MELSSHLNFTAKGQAGFKVWELRVNFQSHGEYSGSPTPEVSGIALADSVHLEVDRTWASTLFCAHSAQSHESFLGSTNTPLVGAILPPCVVLRPTPSSLASSPLLSGLIPCPCYHSPSLDKEEAGDSLDKSIKLLSKEENIGKNSVLSGAQHCAPHG